MELLRCNNKYKKNVIVVDFGSNNDQIENSPNKPIFMSFNLMRCGLNREKKIDPHDPVSALAVLV